MRLRTAAALHACLLAGPVLADTLDKTLVIAPGSTLHLGVEAASVRLAPGAAGKIVLHVESKGTIGEDLMVEAREEAGSVHIDVKRPDSLFGVFSSGRGFETRVLVTAPPDLALDLRVAGGDLKSSLDVTGDASVRVSGGDAQAGRTGGNLTAKVAGGEAVLGDVAGAAELKVSGGDLEVGRIGGPLTAGVAGGSLRFGEVARGAVEVKVSGGDLAGGPVNGTLGARAAGGSLRLGVRGFGAGAEVSASGGDVRLSIDPRAAFEVDASATGGEIRTGFALEVEGRIAGQRVSGKVNGGGPLLRARASGGSIVLEPAGAMESERSR